MKKISIVVGLLFALLTSVASANQATLFRGSSGDGWSAFEQDLTKEGLLKNGVFPTAVLTQIAYGFAKEQKLPAGELGEKEFKNLFLVANNFSETITVTEFRKLGQAGKIVVPDLVPRTATFKTEAPATPVASTPVYGGTSPASPVGPPDGKIAIAITNMEGQVKALQEEVRKSGGTQKEVRVLAGRLKDFGQLLESLKADQGGFATKAGLDVARADLTTLQGEVKDLPKLREDVTGLRTDVDTLKGNPILAWGPWLLAAIAGLFLLCFGAIYRTRRASKADVRAMATQVEAKANAAEAKAKEAMEKVTEATVTALSAKQEVEAVAAEVEHIKKVEGYREVRFPANFDAELKALIEAGGSGRFQLNVGGDIRLIEIETSTISKLVMVRGIKEVTKGVNPDNLKMVIFNAAKLGRDGNHRIIGVSADTHLKAA